MRKRMDRKIRFARENGFEVTSVSESSGIGRRGTKAI
jgi:hypothetical protein